MKKLMLVVLTVAALGGCPPPPPAKVDGPTPAADGGVAVTAPRSQTRIGGLPMSAPVLIVEGVTFTRADIERAISQHAASLGMPPSDMVPEVRDTLEAPAYEKLLDRQLFSAEARKRGLWPSDQKVAEEREKVLRGMPPALTVEGFLAKLGTDDEGFRKEIATDLALGALFEALQKEQKQPDPAVVRKFYDDNKDKFVKPEMASASHILVRLPRTASPDDVAKAQERAAAIRKEVAGKDKATFARVAATKSEDPRAKENKGDLGKFPRGMLVKELDELAFALKDGDVSEVVRSDFGLHIVRGQGISKPGLSTFDEVKAMIAEREGAKVFAASLDELALTMRKTAKVDRLVEPAPSSMMDVGKPPPAGARGGAARWLRGLTAGPWLPIPSRSLSPWSMADGRRACEARRPCGWAAPSWSRRWSVPSNGHGERRSPTTAPRICSPRSWSITRMTRTWASLPIFEVRSPITGNGWRLMAWLEPFVGWRLAYRLWYLIAAEAAFLSALAVAFLRQPVDASGGVLMPVLAVACAAPLAFQYGLYLGTIAYSLGVSLALVGLALLLRSGRAIAWCGLSAVWLASAWLHPVPIAVVGAIGGVAVLSGPRRWVRLGALAVAAGPALAFLVAFALGDAVPDSVADNRFAPLLERTVLVLAKLVPGSPTEQVGLLVLAVVGLALGVTRGPGPERAVTASALLLLVTSMVLPEHAFGWQMVSGRLLPVAVPLALAPLVVAPRRALVPLGALAVVVAAAGLSAAAQRHRGLARAADDALAGIDEQSPVRLRLVEIITRPFGTDAADGSILPPGMEPMAKLSSLWAVRAGGRPMFTFADRNQSVHPLVLRDGEPRSPFPLIAADAVRDAWPERGDDLRRLAISAAPIGGLFAFGEADDARVYDEAGFVRVGGRGAVYVGRFQGCASKVRLSSSRTRTVELTVGWWPRRTPQYAAVSIDVGPEPIVVDTGVLGCGPAWANVTPGRCAEGLPSRASLTAGGANLIDCTVVDEPGG